MMVWLDLIRLCIMSVHAFPTLKRYSQVLTFLCATLLCDNTAIGKAVHALEQ